jgi:hypothetical protein
MVRALSLATLTFILGVYLGNRQVIEITPVAAVQSEEQSIFHPLYDKKTKAKVELIAESEEERLWEEETDIEEQEISFTDSAVQKNVNIKASREIPKTDKPKGIFEGALENLPSKLESFSSVARYNDAVARLNGVLEGDIEIHSGKFKGETHQASLDFNFSDDGQNMNGETDIVVSRNGEIYSRGRGSGDEQLKTIHERPKAHFIEFGPGQFFQIKYVEQDDDFLAILYNNYKAVGTGRLRKK